MKLKANTTEFSKLLCLFAEKSGLAYLQRRFNFPFSSWDEESRLTGLSEDCVLDRIIPTPVTFSGSNNPFNLSDEKIREARKLICTRKLEVEDMTKVSSQPGYTAVHLVT